MNEAEKIISLVVNMLDDAIQEANKLAPDGIDRVKTKKLRRSSMSNQVMLAFHPENLSGDDFYDVEHGPIMLVPFERLRERLINILPIGGDDES